LSYIAKNAKGLPMDVWTKINLKW